MSRRLWLELLLISLLAASAAASAPLVAGAWGWSWDALNHHVYLGLISESPRWHLDVMAASVQGWQYPYLYWPVYKLTQLPVSGATAGAIWSFALTLLIVPPVWLFSERLLRHQQHSFAQGLFERTAATTLALLSLVVISSIGTTANDPLAAVPLLWALALMAVPNPSDRRAGLAAALWGVSSAFKLSHVLALPLLFVWLCPPSGHSFSLRRGFVTATGACVGFGLAYAPWGLQLWQETGNPFHPQLRGLFAS